MAVKFYLDEENFTKEYRETATNRTAFWAVRNRKETQNELLDFNEVIWDYDVPEIVDTLKRMGETRFTISSTVCGLVALLQGFEKFGVHIAGITEVNASYKDFRTGELQRIPALLMEIK